MQEKFPDCAVETDGLGTSVHAKSNSLGFPLPEYDEEDSSFYSSSDDENSSDCADKGTRGNEDDIDGAAGYIGSRKSNDSDNDVHSDSSAEFFASSGYVRLQTKHGRAKKTGSNDETPCMNNADSANNEYEQSSIDGASSSDHEDLMHQQLLEPARNDSFSASSDEGDNLDNIPWLYTSADEPKAYPMNRKRSVKASCSNPFGKKFDDTNLSSGCTRTDDVFRQAPFPRVNWDFLDHQVSSESQGADSTESSNNTHHRNSIEKNVFANAPWTYALKFNDDDMGPGKENVFDGAPLGCLSFIVPLTLSQ